MKKYTLFSKKYWFSLCIALIIVLATLLRFYNFENRWGLAYDQARDVLVAQEALKRLELPLIGPFSSAGQFVYGPQWFWVLMVMISLYPYSLITPWVVQVLLFIAITYVMIHLGKEIEGQLFALLVGCLIAVSPGQIAQSTNLTSPSMVGIFSILSLYLFILYFNKPSGMYAFLLGFLISTSINIHFQAIGLLAFVPVSLLFTKWKAKNIVFMGIGLLVPFIPLIIFDLKTNFYESRGIIDYYLYGQHRIYVPNRWLTYAGVFWPNAWSRIIGGNAMVGYIILFLFSILLVYKTYKRRLSKLFLALLINFFLIFVMLRYYKGERYDSYIVFLHPFVFLFTAWVLLHVAKINRFLGILLFCVVIGMSLESDFREITTATNESARRSYYWKNFLVSTYPDKKFAFYDYRHQGTAYSFPLVLFLEADGKLADNGYRIGFGTPAEKDQPHLPQIKGNKLGFDIRDLNNSSPAQLMKDEWAFINPSEVYQSTEEWYRKK